MENGTLGQECIHDRFQTGHSRRKVLYAGRPASQYRSRRGKSSTSAISIPKGSTIIFRADLRFGFRLNNSNRKISQTIYLDLQNVTARDNVFIQRYNRALGKVGIVNQIGFFPDILYRIQF